MPEGSHPQLLKFLDDLNIPYQFFNSHTDIKAAPTLKRKLERHWNKLKSEFVLLKCLHKVDLNGSIVHIELAPWQSFLALAWLCTKTKVFVTVHNSILPIPKHRFFLWQAKFRILTKLKNFHIFTANNEAKESLKKLVANKNYEKITVTRAYINPSEIEAAEITEKDRRAFCRKFKIPENKFLIFCVGQFIDRKGRWIFLDAAEKLLQANQELAFIWISNSNPSAADLKRARNYKLGENFIFITSDEIGGEHIDLLKLLKLADVFSLPSYLEGLPISLLEAMALGIPSISTKINGIPEAIKHLETGFLIEPGSSAELVSAIQKLKDDKILREKLSKQGREFVMLNFNQQTVAKIAIAKYLEALDER